MSEYLKEFGDILKEFGGVWRSTLEYLKYFGVLCANPS